jgi:NADPH:quinone reductase-like Zn-dependent oxidoreductase
LQKAQAIAGFMKNVWPALNQGQFRLFIDQVFPFSQLAQTKDRMLANQLVGKIVLSMS